MGVTFTLGAARRVAAAVKRLKRTPERTGNRQRRLSASPPLIRWIIRGKLQAQLAKDGSASIKVWYFDGNNEVETNETITGHDWMLKTGQTIASGKKVVASFDIQSGRFYVTSAECP